MTAQKFATHLSEDRRLVMLRLLAELQLYRANSTVLWMNLEAHGHAITRDQTKTELRWLEEQGLVSIEEAAGLLIATLTERGQDVASGRAKQPGVARPGA